MQNALAYLDKAVGRLKELGISFSTQDQAPAVKIVERLAVIDEGRCLAIARVLQEAGNFNELVRREVDGASYGDRYEAISGKFDSIRDDARKMVGFLDDGKVSTFEKVQMGWMKMTRGDIPARFEGIRDTYISVAKDTHDQLERESGILEAYKDFRGGLKSAEVEAQEVLKQADGLMSERRTALEAAQSAVADFAGDDGAEKARLELARDEAIRALQDEEKRYQVAKDLADNLKIAYHTSEAVMARLQQMTDVKERVYQQGVTFFTTNDVVLSALSAAFTSQAGLHEATESLNAMSEGVSQSLETLAEVSDVGLSEGVKAGYGPTVRAEAVSKLVDAVVGFQERVGKEVAEARTLATENAAMIERAVEDGKSRFAELQKTAA